MRYTLPVALLIAVQCTTTTKAGSPASEIVKSVAKQIAGKTAIQAARETAEQAGKAIVKQASKETAELVAKRGLLSTVRHFGDELVSTGAKSLKFTDDLAKVSSKTTAQSQRRLSMLAKEWNNSGKTADAVQVLAASTNPDAMIERLWKHRAKIAAGAAVTAVMLHGDDMVHAAGEFMVKPAIDGGMKHVAAPIVAKTSGFGISIFAVAFVLICGFAMSVWFQTRRLRQLGSVMAFASRKVSAFSRR